MVLWFMAAKRPVHYGVGFGREAAKMSIFELDFGREAATYPFWHVFGRAAANLSIFEVDFGREEVTCPFWTCFWPWAANLSISSTFFEDMSNMFFLKMFKKKLYPWFETYIYHMTSYFPAFAVNCITSTLKSGVKTSEGSKKLLICKVWILSFLLHKKIM